MKTKTYKNYWVVCTERGGIMVKEQYGIHTPLVFEEEISAKEKVEEAIRQGFSTAHIRKAEIKTFI